MFQIGRMTEGMGIIGPNFASISLCIMFYVLVYTVIILSLCAVVFALFKLKQLLRPKPILAKLAKEPSE